MSQSIADQFIDVMARVRELEQYTGNDEPMRHQVRQLKHVAESILSNACREAYDITVGAKGMIKDAREAAKEAAAGAK